MRPVHRFNFAVWLLLAVELVACSGQRAPTLPPDALTKKVEATKFTVPAEPWIDPAPIEGLALELEAPKKLPQSAAVIQMRVALENRSAALVSLGAPTPCAITDWRILDSKGQTVMRKRPSICEQVVQNHPLQPGEVIEQTADLPLEPDVLQAGSAYRLQYEFWGQLATAAFTVE
jgi:hypothetical protein